MKLIATVARSKRKVNLAVVPDSQNVESERESRTRDACSAVKSMQDWETDVESIGVQRFKARAHETEMMTVVGTYFRVRRQANR